MAHLVSVIRDFSESSVFRGFDKILDNTIRKSCNKSNDIIGYHMTVIIYTKPFMIDVRGTTLTFSYFF